MTDKPPPKYHPGDYVLIDQIYLIEGSLTRVDLDTPMSAVVVKNKGHTSQGYAYVLDINFKPDERPDNLANVCYWEDHIMTKMEDPEETFWKVWGDR